MEQPPQDIAPWEVPPEEAYWQALLREGEYGEGTAILASDVTRTSEPEPDAASPAETVEPRHTEEVQQTREVHHLAADPPPVIGDPGCWEMFTGYQAEGKPIELSVDGYNRGGLLVRWNNVVGFVPASQLCDGLRYGDEQTRLEDLAMRVGSMLTLRVIEVDAVKNRLIFSERAARHIEEPDMAILDTLDAGDVCSGHITNLCTFGAFVDLGGIEGLIHISELSWGRVAHPSDVLKSGQEVEVYVLNVDRNQGRVGLSLKRLQPDPWDSVEERYQVGQSIEGTVTNIVNFGAFVRLEEGLEGLIHASELTGGMMPALHSLREGETVLVRINSIEGPRHRIGLSLEHL